MCDLVKRTGLGRAVFLRGRIWTSRFLFSPMTYTHSSECKESQTHPTLNGRTDNHRADMAQPNFHYFDAAVV